MGVFRCALKGMNGFAKRAAKAATIKGQLKGKALLVFVAVGAATSVLALAMLSMVGVEAAKSAPSDVALADIPPAALEAYLAAGDHCEGLQWNVLAGIGKVESNHGRVFGGQIEGDGDVVPPIFGAALNGSGAGGNTTPWPSGQWEGQWGLTSPWLRALGPMQFISPSWSAFGQDGNGDGVEDPHNIFDGALAAAQLLCESQGGEITDISDALFSYNRSTEYGELVLHWARLYVALPIGSFDASVEDLLNHPNIELAPRARGDLEAGVVDPRLVSALVSAAEDFTMYIGWFKTGHSECVGGGSIAQRPSCTISNHHFGRAADIGAVGFAGESERPLVRPNNEAAEALTNRWGAMDLEDPLRPESLGSPWDSGVFHGHFTDGNHLDHLHVAWRSDPPPPHSINATRHGLDDGGAVFPWPPSTDWFVPIVLPARSTEVVAGPADVQSVINSAGPSTRIVLSSGFYPPIRVRGANGLSIVAGSDGVATFAAGDIERSGGVIVEDSSDVTIAGLSFTDSLWGIQVRNSSNVTIAGNTISRIGQEAIHVSDHSSNVTIQNNLISHTGLRSGVDPEQGLPYRTFGEGIYIGTGRPAGVDFTNNVTIVGNEIHHTSAEAIEVKPGAFNVTINRNIIHDTSTQTKGAVVIHVGDYPSNSGGISVRRNLIWNTSATSQYRDGNAIVVSGPAHVQANVIWDSQHRGILVQEVYGSQRSVTVRRNVVFDTPMGDVVVEAHSPALSPNIGDNLDGTILQHEQFAGGWLSGNRPTEALALLVSALDDDTVPIGELESVFAPEVPVSGPIPVVGGAVNGSYTVAQVIDGTIGAGDGSNPNEEAPMGRHEASLYLPQGWNWTQGPTRNAQWGQLGSGSSRYAEWRCAVIPEFGHTPPVPFRVNVRNGAYYQFVSGSWSKAFDVDLTGGNHGGYLGNPGVVNADPFSAHGHGQIQWRREADGSFSAPWNPSALFMHLWAGRRQAPAPGQTAEFLTSEMRLQQPDGQTVDLSQVKVLYQCGVDYYSVTSGQGTKVPGPGIAKYNRLMEVWRPGLWVTLPANVPAGSTADFERWLAANLPPNVSSVGS